MLPRNCSADNPLYAVIRVCKGGLDVRFPLRNGSTGTRIPATSREPGPFGAGSATATCSAKLARPGTSTWDRSRKYGASLPATPQFPIPSGTIMCPESIPGGTSKPEATVSSRLCGSTGTRSRRGTSIPPPASRLPEAFGRLDPAQPDVGEHPVVEGRQLASSPGPPVPSPQGFERPSDGAMQCRGGIGVRIEVFHIDFSWLVPFPFH